MKYKEEAETVLKQNTDVRCDIYSLGATFYHLLTNQLPTDVVKRTLESWEGELDPLPNPSDLEPNIPPSISACLLKAMEIKRDNRFSSALEMQEALQTAIEEEKLRKNEVKSRQTVKEIKLQDAKKEETREQLPAQAVTEKLVPKIEIKDEIENDFMLSASSAPTEPLNPPPSDTQTSSEFITTQESDFQQSENISKAEPTGKVYHDEILPDKKKVVSGHSSFMEKEIEDSSKNNAKMFWLLPIAALSILTVSGIGGIMWMSSSDSTNSNKPETKVVISTPSATATTSPTIAPSASPTNSPAPIISDKQKPSPTAAPKTVKPQPTQNPVKTPAVQKTPKPKKPSNLSDRLYLQRQVLNTT